MAEVVDIKKVSFFKDGLVQVKRMERVLEKQGQIEPLQVWKFQDFYFAFSEDAWGAEIVQAAKNLGWTTLLVLVTDKYLTE